jgi:hypothetical protein
VRAYPVSYHHIVLHIGAAVCFLDEVCSVKRYLSKYSDESCQTEHFAVCRTFTDYIDIFIVSVQLEPGRHEQVSSSQTHVQHVCVIIVRAVSVQSISKRSIRTEVRTHCSTHELYYDLVQQYSYVHRRAQGHKSLYLFHIRTLGRIIALDQ